LRKKLGILQGLQLLKWRLIQTMSVNEDYFDASLRHAIGIRRFTAGEVRKILELLERADADLTARLRKRLRVLAGRPFNVRGQQLRALLQDVAIVRRELMKKLRAELRGDLLDLAKTEVGFEGRLITSALPISVELAGVEAAVLRSAVLSKPFSGGQNAARTLQQWFRDLAQVDQKRLIAAIQMSLVKGETVGEAVRRIAGTRKMGFRDGVLAVTRRNAEAIVRTAINHISNVAREALWDANADLIDGLRWTSTLDGRTTRICQSRDGKIAPIGGKPIPRESEPLVPPGARPPAHVQCRSLLTAVISANGVALSAGERPFVRDVRTGRRRQRDFRAEAKAQAGERWSRMGRSQRNMAVRDVRRTWAQGAVGQVPTDVTYGQWLKRQSDGFQNETLGKARARLFRDGGLSLDAFVDIRGNELTLAQLAKTEPEAFLKVGLSDLY
jgi:hypothetical protein